MTKPYIICIAGGSASGKSTLCGQLENGLADYKIKALHMDYYFKPEDKRPFVKAPITKKMYVDDNHPETMDLTQFHQDMKAAADNRDIDIIIAEGLLTLYDDNICGMADLKLYVECRPDERIVRRLKRNMAAGYSFDEIAAVYLDMVRYRHDEYVEASKWKADLIINGSSFSETTLDVLLKTIKSAV